VVLVGEESVSGVTAEPPPVNRKHPFMRVYIIGNDGITLCRTAPATLNDGEIAVASNEELHAAPLSAKRLLALWNALPGVEKRKKVGNRDALIDQLWSAIEALPDPEPQPDPKPPLQISEFPTGDFGSNRQAVSLETDRVQSGTPLRMGFGPDFGEPPLRDISYLAVVCQSKYSCHYL
jgi:hypothetical protein